MDKKNDCKIPKYGTRQVSTPENLVVGAKQLKKAVMAGRAQQVFLAENADPAVTEPLASLCGEHHIQITWVSTMAELGQACGIEVGAAAAAVLQSKILPEAFRRIDTRQNGENERKEKINAYF